MPEYANFDPNVSCDSKVMSLFSKRTRLTEMRLGEAFSPFCIVVAGQCYKNKHVTFDLI